MARIRLPDGSRIQCLVRSEARVLIEHARGYLEHGITLPNDGVILDVGANVGVFSVLLARKYPGVSIHAFEPVPPIHEVLQQNADTVGSGRITVHPYGLGAQADDFEFLYFPRCPALSSAHMELWDAAPGAFTQAVRGQIRQARKTLWLARLVPGFLAGPVARYLQGGAQRHRCTIRPLSEVFERHEIRRVDLLKIDCEGAELAVLEGVAPERWPSIQQVVCEVMDVEGRLEACRSLLQTSGFDEIIVAQEAGLEDTPMVNLYARRS